jgi:hypothetical protein
MANKCAIKNPLRWRFLYITAMMITRNERDIEERKKKVIEGVKSW